MFKVIFICLFLILFNQLCDAQTYEFKVTTADTSFIYPTKDIIKMYFSETNKNREENLVLKITDRPDYIKELDDINSVFFIADTANKSFYFCIEGLYKDTTLYNLDSLKQITFDFKTIGVTDNDVTITPLKTYPNPFSEAFTIDFALLEPAIVSIYLTDLESKLVQKMEIGYKEIGEYKIPWSVSNTDRTNISSGLYNIIVKTDKSIITKKIIRVK